MKPGEYTTGRPRICNRGKYLDREKSRERSS